MIWRCQSRHRSLWCIQSIRYRVHEISRPVDKFTSIAYTNIIIVLNVISIYPCRWFHKTTVSVRLIYRWCTNVSWTRLSYVLSTLIRSLTAALDHGWGSSLFQNVRSRPANILDVLEIISPRTWPISRFQFVMREVLVRTLTWFNVWKGR